MADTILYTVLHSGDARDCAKGPVRALPCTGAGYAAHYFEGHGLVEPDLEAVRACLPHRWRAAWDRHAGGMWFTAEEPGKDSKRPCYRRLTDSRGRYLTTIYLQPYRFA